jgi:hypothetical protein
MAFGASGVAITSRMASLLKNSCPGCEMNS